ncbi:peptidylprolyl isomerase [Pedobacter psychrophilus]|uniref:peptidylprolyl isomerase n=1 Tax=Pedobacter psychrophilus TaxID=1826909 RepID=A0A179DCA9_9SPHI|nr:peptidylprolyl isomerase [Pedobacter psychrophilus]OAQ38671.1 peptidylprolyl isomerase [Pedobacter psychrophilus]
MKKLLLPIFCLFFFSSFAAKPKNTYIKITTNYGEVYLKLYNETPKHRDNFIKIIKDGTLNQTLFHRVIQEFMIQGGDPTSKTAKPGQQLGDGDLGYTIPAEFNPNLFHKKGALAAARDNNPEKASSASQFYIVQGKVFTEEELDAVEKNRMAGRKIPKEQREVYKTIGGTPHLDQNYTVFGEVVKGLIMVDNICTVKVDGNNRPLTDIKMTVSLVEKKELRELLKEIKN